MTSFNYARTAATSLRLLTRYGQNVTLRSYTAGTYSTDTSSAAPSASDTPRKGVLLAFAPNKTNGPGGLIEVGDRRLLLEPAAALTIKDHIIVDSVEYVVKGFDEISPAGTPVLYDVHLRVGG